MQKRRRMPTFSPDRTAQAVSILIHEGKLRLQDLTRALERREKIITDLRARLVALEEGASGNTRRRGRGPRKARRARHRKTTKRISKARRAAQRTHGRYLGAISRLSVAARARVKAIREESGVRAAIASAKKMAKA